MTDRSENIKLERKQLYFGCILPKVYGLYYKMFILDYQRNKICTSIIQ